MNDNLNNPSADIKPRRSKKLVLILILLIVVGGGIAALKFSGMLGGGDGNSPGFGQPDTATGEAPKTDGTAGTQPEEGPYEDIGNAPGAAPAATGFDEAKSTQQCSDKFNNDIRARGQNPDDFATARNDYVKQCVDFVRQQSAGK